MPRGTPVTIAGTQYPRSRRAKSATNSKRKIKAAVGPSGKRLKGHGDYQLVDGKQKQYTPFGSVGSTIGGWLGAPGVGWAAGHLVGRLLGSGDYMISGFPVSKNVLVNGKELPEFANVSGLAGGSTMVCHREYIGDVVSSGTARAFKVQKYSINPGDYVTFPWLSTLSQNYDQYKIHGMVFEFKSTSGDAMTSTDISLGTVIMATDYDVLDRAFVSKQEMENSQFAQASKPSNSQLHAIECEPSQNALKAYFIRRGELASTQNKMFYDFANFYIATSGFQGTNVVAGELWVSYCIEFLKPQVPLTPGGGVKCMELTATGISSSAPWGTTPTDRGGTLSYTHSARTITVSGCKGGQKLLALAEWSGTSTAVQQGATTYANCTALTGVLYYGNSVTTAYCAQVAYLQVNADGDVTFTISTNDSWPASSTLRFTVTTLDDSVTVGNI